MAKKRNIERALIEEDDASGLFAKLRDSGKGLTIVLGCLLLFLVLVYALVLNAIRPHTPGRELAIDELQQKVRDKEITEVTFLAEDHRLIGTDSAGNWWTGIGPNDLLAPDMLTDFVRQGVRTRIDTQTPKNLLIVATTFLLPVATLIVGFALLYTLMRRGPGEQELAVMGRARGRRYTSAEDSTITFADVAGLQEAITELKEVRDFLKHPETFEQLGAKPPRGILLLGPPGCGKTLLAKAVAGEAGVPFFSVSASSFMEMLVGVGPSRVRDLFKKAREAAPSIIFVDEIDAVGRTRTSGSLNSEGESTLNELLIQLDGFDSSQRVVLMAATNRADILDSALLRKGRFDRQVVIDTPDKAGRLAIFKVHARGKPVAADVDFERFAGRTVGLSGADIAAVMNEAATLAARRRLTAIGAKEISEGIDRVFSGPEMRSRILGPDEKRRVAYHEAGHTLVGWVLNTAAQVDKVSIVARGHALGLTWSLPIEDRRLKTRSQIEEEITASLGGLAAETVVYDDPSGGSQSDLMRATALARQMVYDLGMSDLGPIFLGSDDRYGLERSDRLTEEADREVCRILADAEERARTVVSAYRSHLDRVVELLVAQETLEHDDLTQALGDLPKGLPTGEDLAAEAAKPGASRPASSHT
ncbi:MAG TPA: ATP-dependent zinc metalloprotease FtsH [Acidimicrobiales bacterium]|nr:ATP-dependent zinc metalloprotease FtsH [Acidimicrobiales bacterium]